MTHILCLTFNIFGKCCFATKNGLVTQKYPKYNLMRCLVFIFIHFKFLSREKFIAAIFKPLFAKVKLTPKVEPILSQRLSQSSELSVL